MTEERRGDTLAVLLKEASTALDTEIARSGALDRVRNGVLMQSASYPMAGLSWRQLAAAVVLAAMLGGTVGFLLPERGADPADGAVLSLLDEVDAPGAQ